LPKENRLLSLLKGKGITENQRVILLQGTLSLANSIEHLLEAMTLLPQDTVLVLLGWVSQDYISDIYRRSDSLHIKERVIYIPQVPYRDILYYTIGAHLGIALYKPLDLNRRYNAGASNKLFEYLSLGIPVVTNDTLPFREVVDETMVYFANPDSTEDIARAINSALSDREGYLRKSNAARAAHLDKFNFEEQFEEVREYIMKRVGKCR
jgi:glycosyltransferase involved in cell wall biosynthesis